MTEAPRPRRPHPLATIPERLARTTPDPGTLADERSSAADLVAQALVSVGRRDGFAGVEHVERLVRLADDVGMDELDAIWRGAEAGSLPAALRVLYLLRSWAAGSAGELARLAGLGRAHAEVAATVAGISAYPSAEDLRRLVDDLLRGALGRDLPTALHRAAALCRVLAAGYGAQEPVDLPPDVPADLAADPPAGPPPSEPAKRDAVLGARLLTTARDLDLAAASAAARP